MRIALVSVFVMCAGGCSTFKARSPEVGDAGRVRVPDELKSVTVRRQDGREVPVRARVLHGRVTDRRNDSIVVTLTYSEHHRQKGARLVLPADGSRWEKRELARGRTFLLITPLLLLGAGLVYGNSNPATL